MAEDHPPAMVAQCWRYPVKSMQGLEADRLLVERTCIAGDRVRGVITSEGVLLSAKERRAMLFAVADDEGIGLPDGRRVAYDDGDLDGALSTWLGTEVRLSEPEADRSATYRMTFDPPDDDADLVEIPTPAGSFVDLAPVHLLTTPTLRSARETRPDLNWDVRRFRPNLVIDLPGPPFVEHDWVGGRLALGDTLELQVDQATVRCAMPLRAQPGLDREVALFDAMRDLTPDLPNHLGVYCSVVEPGVVEVGDPVRLIDG